LVKDFVFEIKDKINFFSYSRETRSVPGNESINGEKPIQHIGDLIVNLIEILPVKII